MVGNEEGSPKKSLESLFETSSRQGGRDEDEIFFFLLFPDAAFPFFPMIARLEEVGSDLTGALSGVEHTKV